MKKPLLLAIFLVGFAASAFAQTTAFVGVNVVPMDRERIIANQTVVVRDGVITEIGDVMKVKVPSGAVRVNGTGKYLIPGLVDMHTHLLSDGEEYPDSIAGDELRVMVANGVTTVRFMIGTPELLAYRAQSAKGEIAAPTIWVASPHLTGREQGNNFVVKTEEEARDAVRKSKAAGYDFIKVTTFVPPAIYEAAVDEAAKQGIRMVGHADREYVTAPRAWKAKQHIDFIDEAKIARVAKVSVEANPFSNPTQHFFKNTFALPRSEESIRAQPDFKFYPKKVQDQWLAWYKRSRLITEVSAERKMKWIDARNKLIKAIHDNGGKLMAGSDTPEFLWLYGFAMHHELKALRDAGIGNYAALAAGTRNPHEFLGSLSKSGTVEKGKAGDLILLNKNPLDDIAATYDRAGVMLKGKYYTQAELNGWLDEIAPKIAGSHIEHKPAPGQ